MAENPPPLDATSRLNVDLSLLPPLVNGDGTQVILVQVNPGETFTIRREDGQLQCITGPAQVPMVSPNGSVPPIYVPPGYVSQVIEENGVRRVLVLPQQPEFHPGSHPPIHPHPYMPTFLHPPVLQHHQMYSTGPGDVATQYVPQHHPPHSYADQESHPAHGRSNYIHRDERTSKAYDRLQKKLKERQANGSKDKISSPSSSPHKCHFVSLTSEQNEQGILEKCIEKNKQDDEKEGTPEKDAKISADEDADKKVIEAVLSSVSKPMVSDIQARTVVLTWATPSATVKDDAASDFLSEPYSYEVAISNGGKDEKFKVVNVGKDEGVTLQDLKPATDYHARVQAVCNLIRGSPSESESFRTLCSEPDTPMAPRVKTGPNILSVYSGRSHVIMVPKSPIIFWNGMRVKEAMNFHSVIRGHKNNSKLPNYHQLSLTGLS